MTEQHLTISRVGWRGEGVAEGPVFVPCTLPGEVVTAEVQQDRGRLISVEEASPERIAPFCPHFGHCGGCQLQHWQEGAYRAWKVAQVEQAFAKSGIDATVSTLIDAHGAGRRRVSLHVRRKDGVVTAGFMAVRSHDLYDLDRCPILAPALKSALDMAREIGKVLGDCDVAATATEGGLDLRVRAERRVVAEEHAKLATLAERLDVARFTVNADVIVVRRSPVVHMGRASVLLPSASFLQATAAGEEALATLVLDALGKSKSVADLFCGCGPFTFRLAEKAKVQAFDSDAPAIAALLNAARNTQGLKPVAAEARNLMTAPLVVGELKDFDCVVFDPPRAGAEAQARQLARSEVKTIAAVSCDPLTLARDARILLDGGYSLSRLTAVDQFKWSSHVECVAVFSRRKK